MGCHAPPPGDLPNPKIEPKSPSLQEDSLPSEPPGKPSAIEKENLTEVTWPLPLLWEANVYTTDLRNDGCVSQRSAVTRDL